MTTPYVNEKWEAAKAFCCEIGPDADAICKHLRALVRAGTVRPSDTGYQYVRSIVCGIRDGVGLPTDGESQPAYAKRMGEAFIESTR